MSVNLAGAGKEDVRETNAGEERFFSGQLEEELISLKDLPQFDTNTIQGRHCFYSALCLWFEDIISCF